MEALAFDSGVPFPDAHLRAAEVAWLQEHRAELAEHYPGEWLALDGPQLVAHGTDLATVTRLAATAGHPNPFITAVPATDAPRYFAGEWSMSTTGTPSPTEGSDLDHQPVPTCRCVCSAASRGSTRWVWSTRARI